MNSNWETYRAMIDRDRRMGYRTEDEQLLFGFTHAEARVILAPLSTKEET